MAKCDLSFDIGFREPPKLIAMVSEEVQQAGGTLKGDATQGEITVLGIVARYSLRDRVLEVAIVEKPFFASCDRIEKFITSAIAKVPQMSIEVPPGAQTQEQPIVAKERLWPWLVAGAAGLAVIGIGAAVVVAILRR